ncbi:SRPBCC family protein [Streptomyces sp. NPDC048436]|uniref:SRPBCC family protein n=1 Tax=Streptomyces sp. NPDC048436 TaxID=3365550 RepID=UPI00371DEE65
MNPHTDSLTPADDGHSVLRMERRLAHPPARVWAAITRPEHLAQWFPSEVTVDLRPGGAMGFHFPGDEGPGMTGEVTDVEEPRLFAFSWGDDHLRWEITPDGPQGADGRQGPEDPGGQGSLLTLIHTFGDRFGAPSFAAGWQLCVSALGQFLDGGKAEVSRDAGELHEAYLEQFDLGHGTVTGDGIRFERQLVRSADAVWAELCDGEVPLEGDTAPDGFLADGVSAGPVTELRAPESLTYAVYPKGEVRWELGQGTGYGARLVLTQSGPFEDAADKDRHKDKDKDKDKDEALAAWHARIERLAGQLLEGPSSSRSRGPAAPPNP